MLRNLTPVRVVFLGLIDFRSKLVILVVIMAVCLLWNDPFLQLGLFVGVLVLCWFSGISRRYLGAVLGLMAPFSVTLIIVHGLFNIQQVQRLLGGADLTWVFHIPTNWWLIGGGGMTLEGVLYGLNVGLKSMTLLLAFPLIVLTTDVDEMLAGLLRLRIPYILAFIFSATLRFFPLLFSEAQVIIDAQRLRGIAVEKMNLFKRAQVYARTAVPLILSSMVKSQQLEISLHSKGFAVSKNRTSFHEVTFKTLDWLALLTSLVFLLLTIYMLVFWGVGKFHGL